MLVSEGQNKFYSIPNSSHFFVDNIKKQKLNRCPFNLTRKMKFDYIVVVVHYSLKFLIFIKPVFTLPSSIVKQWKSGDYQIV